MKIRNSLRSLKNRHRDCRVVRRKGRIYVINKTQRRFKVTATGRIKVQQAGKRHGMIKRSNKFIRNARGTTVLSPQDEKIVKQFLPYA